MKTEVNQNKDSSSGFIELEDVLWGDWERPERIASTLRAIGREPAFSGEYVKTHELVEVS